MAVTKEEIVEAIGQMSVLELTELVKNIEEKFGVSPLLAAPVAGVGAGAAPAAPVEEKTDFTVVLASYPPDKKIQVIKVVRELTSLGLKEAKDLVEGSPKTVKEGLPKDMAEQMKKKIEETGAKVEIK